MGNFFAKSIVVVLVAVLGVGFCHFCLAGWKCSRSRECNWQEGGLFPFPILDDPELKYCYDDQVTKIYECVSGGSADSCETTAPENPNPCRKVKRATVSKSVNCGSLGEEDYTSTPWTAGDDLVSCKEGNGG